ncbi:MAG: primosomal protein N', partial [Paramuribaculum sp.]|nr:primosomal protein N' [Paramuribaculum sp.]
MILPLPLPGAFTYEVPPELEAVLREGHRVVVPCGKRKLYTGIVAALGVPRPPQNVDVKSIDALLDDAPVVRSNQLRFWSWIADYYFATPGDVMKAALPAGLKLESETFLELAPDWEEDPEVRLTKNEVSVVQVLDHEGKRMALADIAKATGIASISRTVSRLIDKGAVTVSERVVERFRARRISCVRLAPALLTDGSDPSFASAFAAVKGAPKQERALLALLD